ncbi:MAG: type II secretion system F family protein [Thermoguttaceae bacterium]
MRLPFALFKPKITLEQLSLFSGNLATCVSAGLDIPKSLDTCQRSSPSPVLREILTSAARQTSKGMKLFDALEPHKSCFPAFFLPVVRCGEESGHLDGTLRYLENHCRLLARPTRAIHNTWFVPLCLMLGGTGICIVAYWLLAPRAMAIQFVIDSVRFYAIVAIAIWAVFYVPPCRALAEYLRLALPVIGPAERELTMDRFFHAMNVLYSTGGRRVEEMIRLAADSAENSVLRSDFLRAAKAIETGSTIGEAFSAVASIPFRYKTSIVAGDEAGRLEDAFNMICRESGESVVSLLAGFQPVFFRIVALGVILSVTGTLYSLAFLRH